MFLPIDLTPPLHLPLTRLSSSPRFHSLFSVILILRFFSFFLLLSSLFLFSLFFSLALFSLFIFLLTFFFFICFSCFLPSSPFLLLPSLHIPSPIYITSSLLSPLPPPNASATPSPPPQQTHPPKSLIHPPLPSFAQHLSPSIPRPTPNTYQQNRKTMSAIGLHYFKEEREEKEKDVCKEKECKE